MLLWIYNESNKVSGWIHFKNTKQQGHSAALLRTPLLLTGLSWRCCCEMEGEGKPWGSTVSCNPHLCFNVNEFQILLERSFRLGNSGCSGPRVGYKGLGGVEWGRWKGKEVAYSAALGFLHKFVLGQSAAPPPSWAEGSRSAAWRRKSGFIT